MVGTEAPVADADALRDLGSAHAASSMVRVTPDGELTLYRPGAQDAYAHQLMSTDTPRVDRASRPQWPRGWG